MQFFFSKQGFVDRVAENIWGGKWSAHTNRNGGRWFRSRAEARRWDGTAMWKLCFLKVGHVGRRGREAEGF